MKIDKDVFVNFLHKVTLNNTVGEVLLSCKPEGMRCHVFDGNATMVKALINKINIKEYTEGIEVGISDANYIQSLANRFTKEITLLIKDNVLKMKEGAKEITITLAAKDFIKTWIDKDMSLKETQKFKLETKELRELSKDLDVFKESEIDFHWDVGKLTVIIEKAASKDQIAKTFMIPAISGKGHSKFQKSHFQAIVSALSAMDVNVTIGNVQPIILEESGPINSEIVLAPIVSQEAGETVAEPVEIETGKKVGE